MRCDACGSGDSLFVVVSGNSQGEIRLCQVCALEKGYLSDEGLEVLPQLESILGQLDRQDPPVEAEPVCPLCGMGQEQLVAAGRLGCPGCVQAFKRQFLLARKRRGLPSGYAGRIPRGFAIGAAKVETGLKRHPAQDAVQDAVQNTALDKSHEAAQEAAQVTAPIMATLESSRLLADIESAVLAEDFEKAALLRDRLDSGRGYGKPDNET
jgi:protein-arginine kinase activator protein McsA